MRLGELVKATKALKNPKCESKHCLVLSRANLEKGDTEKKIIPKKESIEK